MLFNSPAFAVFLPIMLAAYWAVRGSTRRAVLLAGSYFFYAWWDWRFLALLLISTVVDFCCARTIDRARDNAATAARARLLLAVSVVTNLGILASFKYFNFFRDSVAAGLALCGVSTDLPGLDVMLPMGISFYTFQTMSYTIDVYRGKASEKSLLSFAVFVACFPQLVAGPIMRAGKLLPQINRDAAPGDVDLSQGVYRIFRGLFKKMVVADALALYVDQVFAAPADYSGVAAWIALYAYAFQIYMDFSGYTDVAIGVGRLLGFRFTENFDRPYLAASPSEFWRRWHITLSTWLRDYLYIPLGGSRNGTSKTMRNLFLTMALGGLWHGAAWTFVAWGVYHGILLAGERGLGLRRSQSNVEDTPWSTQAVRILVMFHLTCLGWLLFRAPDWGTAHTLFANLFDFGAGDVRGLRCLTIVLACAAAHALPAFRDFGDRFARVPYVGQGILAGLCMWALLLLSPSAKPFIYFQF